MKKAIFEILDKSLKKEGINLTQQEIENIIEIPPEISMGDYALKKLLFLVLI